MNILLRVASFLLLSSACIGCDSTPLADLDAHRPVAIGGPGTIAADQLCSRLTSDEVGRAIGRRILRQTMETTHGVGVMHMCDYYFGESDRDRVEVSIALDATARPALGDATWPPALNVSCESVGVGDNEVGGCSAILAQGIRATVLGRGGVVSALAAQSMIAALRNQP